MVSRSIFGLARSLMISRDDLDSRAHLFSWGRIGFVRFVGFMRFVVSRFIIVVVILYSCYSLCCCNSSRGRWYFGVVTPFVFFFFVFYKLTLASLCSQIGFNSSFPCASLTKILQGFPYGSTSTWLPFIFSFRTNSLSDCGWCQCLGARDHTPTPMREYGYLDDWPLPKCEVCDLHKVWRPMRLPCRMMPHWGHPVEWLKIAILHMPIL